ncbi:MAG: terpene cyclase/mutase family protein [Planctomycetes bacterium]|nr:terpene cyclase/mutase family protein [Planctomycetota bacterium]
MGVEEAVGVDMRFPISDFRFPISAKVAVLLFSVLSVSPWLSSSFAAEKAEPLPEDQKRVVGTLIYPPRTQTRRESSAMKLLTPEVREMTRKALEFIRRSQAADGGWGDKDFPQEVGVSALACLALMGDGSLPRVGPSGRNLAKGVEFLLDHVKEDGQIVARDTYKYGPMYGHAWSTLVLLQVYGNVPWRKDMRDKIARAIQIVLRFQKPDGGWRYKMMKEGESDVLVTLNVLYALRVGIAAGFAIPKDVLDRGYRFIEGNGLPDGRFLYMTGGVPGSVAISGVGALAFHLQGKFDHPLLVAATKYIDFYHKRHSEDDLLDVPYFIYGTWYTSQAMYRAGDEFWHPYYRKIVSTLKKVQQEDGQVFDHRGNAVYPTAVAAIVLQAPLGYMPLYQR